MRPRAFKADALLLLAAAIWGFAFVAQRVGMAHVGPFTFNAVRFALGGLTLVPFILARKGRPSPPSPGRSQPKNRHLMYGGLLAGVVLFGGASLQQCGIVYTTAGKAGFITGLYIVIVPLLGLFWKQRPGVAAWLGALCALVGLYMLTVTGRLTISKGDTLVLGSAFFFAVHVLVIAWLTFKVDPVRLAFVQFMICSALSLVAAAFVETIAVDGIRRAAVPILYAGALSVGVAYTLQVIAQRRAHPGHAAIILSLEAVFAALGGRIMLAEILPARGLVGCALMLLGAVMSKLSYRTEFKGISPGDSGEGLTTGSGER
jgi:drug/metabolite transporter (DMT)-like permease